LGLVASTPGERRFDLSGGALCLDFANTLGDRPRSEQERLHGPGDLLQWAFQTGSLPREARDEIAREATRRPEAARRAFARAIALRETLYRLFSARARGAAPAEADLDELNRWLPRAFGRLRLRAERERLAWEWDPAAAGGLERLLWPVLRSSAELLASPDAEFVRECASDRCSWLFVDRSRTRRRRWCDMKVCGNRAKARRHYRRTRGGSD
jgi:predicted RNA-binding Zn ribbon-like protein